MSCPVLFETERLIARRLLSEEASAMVAIFGDAETMKFVGDTKVLTEADCRYWIDDVTAKNFRLRGYGLIGLFRKVDSQLVACSGVFHPGQQPDAEVMYWLRKDAWGQGYATEIVKALIRFSRGTWGIGRMIVTIHPDNLPSQRVAVKSGFKFLENRINDDGSEIQVWELGATSAY